MNFQLISAILKGAWAIDQEAALGYAPIINNLISQTGIKMEFDFDGLEYKPLFIGKEGLWSINENDEDIVKMDSAPEGSIAVIPISGPLMKNDQFCGPVGMESIGRMIQDAAASKNIDGIILKIDSPGGTVDGTIALAEIIKSVKKPIIAFADGLMASAALWLGSSANEIIAADGKTRVGSVGVLLSFADLQPAYELMGIKFHEVVADQSKDKTKMFNELRAGQYENYKKEFLNPLADEFIKAMKENLPNVKDDQLTGKVYFAENVVGSMVNSVGNFEFAVNRMKEMIDKNKTKINEKSPNKINMTKEFKSIEKVIGSELESTDEGVFLNEEQLEKVDAVLAKVETGAAALETANADKQKAEDDLAAANNTILAKDEEITELKKNAGAAPAKVVSKTETEKKDDGKDANVTSKEKSFLENLDAVEKLYK